MQGIALRVNGAQQLPHGGGTGADVVGSAFVIHAPGRRQRKGKVLTNFHFQGNQPRLPGNVHVQQERTALRSQVIAHGPQHQLAPGPRFEQAGRRPALTPEIYPLFGQATGYLAVGFDFLFLYRIGYINEVDVMVPRSRKGMTPDKITVERIIPVRVPAGEPEDLFPAAHAFCPPFWASAIRLSSSQPRSTAAARPAISACRVRSSSSILSLAERMYSSGSCMEDTFF